MRKRSVNHIADTIFWYAVYMLPIILTVIQSIGIFSNLTFENWEFIYNVGATSDYGFMHLLYDNLLALGFGNGGIVFSALNAIFGFDGILSTIEYPAILLFAEWFVFTVLIHLCVDFILFIPRIAHKWLDDFAKKEN